MIYLSVNAFADPSAVEAFPIITVSKLTMTLPILLFYLLHQCAPIESLPPPAYKISVNASDVVSPLIHFWESTGFCPPEPHQSDCSWFLSEDMRQNLLFIGSLPNKAIKQVRIHWLLDAVTVINVTKSGPVYNFTCLDGFMDLMWSLGLKPGFELMGNPSNVFSDFENKTQVFLWKDLVFKVAKRYIGFMNYYDACSEGLKAASPMLRLGAPGGECHGFDPQSFCWATLNHVVNGYNFFTGKKRDVTLDFISIHKKGEEPDNTQVIFQKETDFLEALHEYLPQLSDVAIFNDEGDPLVGWNKDKWWRADTSYAAMATKVITQHQNLWLSNKSNSINYQLLSNDNGFLSYRPYEFSQRTLLARFQMNNTKPPHVQFIKKPIYSVMGLLSLLGNKQVKASVSKAGCHGDDPFCTIKQFSDVDVLASTYSLGENINSWQLAVLVYYSLDSHNVTSTAQISLHVTDIPLISDPRAVIYQIDNKNGNPVSVWREAGESHTPDLKLLRDMRLHEGPVRVSGPAPLEKQNDGSTTISFTLQMPAVWLLHVCAQPDLPPDQVLSHPHVSVNLVKKGHAGQQIQKSLSSVTGLSLHNITHNQVLITWSDACVHDRCIKTYEVEFSEKIVGPYSRINQHDSFFPSYIHAPSQGTGVCGFYRVRAVDCWDRPGPFSLSVQYGTNY